MSRERGRGKAPQTSRRTVGIGGVGVGRPASEWNAIHGLLAEIARRHEPGERLEGVEMLRAFQAEAACWWGSAASAKLGEVTLDDLVTTARLMPQWLVLGPGNVTFEVC